MPSPDPASASLSVSTLSQQDRHVTSSSDFFLCFSQALIRMSRERNTHVCIHTGCLSVYMEKWRSIHLSVYEVGVAFSHVLFDILMCLWERHSYRRRFSTVLFVPFLLLEKKRVRQKISNRILSEKGISPSVYPFHDDDLGGCIYRCAPHACRRLKILPCWSFLFWKVTGQPITTKSFSWRKWIENLLQVRLHANPFIFLMSPNSRTATRVYVHRKGSTDDDEEGRQTVPADLFFFFHPTIMLASRIFC